MPLSTETAKSTRSLTYFVRIYTTPGTYSGANVVLLPLDPTSATGVPAIDGIRMSKSFDSPVPVCTIDLSRVPTWITRGQGVTVDVGYNGLTQRLFTGFVQSKERGVGKGSIQCMGRLWTAFRTVQIGSRSVDGDTVETAIGDILDYVGLTDNRSLTIPAFTLGTNSSPVMERMPASQMLQTLMDIDGCRVYELGTGQIVIRVVDEVPAPVAYKTYTTTSNATARILEASDREDPEYYRNRVIVTGATITEGSAPDETSRTITATATNTGSALVQPPLPSGTYVDAEYNNHLIDTDAKAADVAIRLLAKFARIPRQLQIELAGDPELELGQTIEFIMPEIDLNDRGFVSGIEHVIDSNGYVTRLTDFRGAGDTGGTLEQNPIAAFTFKSELEVFGATTNVFAALDASNSFDPDGTIASYAWSDNQTTTPEIATLTTQQVLVRADTSGFTGSWDVTLTVTDNDGLTGSTTITIPYTNDDAELVLPAVYAAINNRHSASLDGLINWNDQTVGSGNSISVGARPSDGVNTGHAIFGTSTGRIYRTTDACATAPTLVYTSAAGVAMNDVRWDWRNANVCWAIDENAIVYISLDAGVTWTIYDSLRSTSFSAGVAGSLAFAQGTYTGDGTSSKAITGLGFTPKLVVIKGNTASAGEARIRTDNMGTSKVFFSTSFDGGQIASLDADGFTVAVGGAAGNVNANGVAYYWYALGGDSVTVGSYTGNASNPRSFTGLGFSPALMWVKAPTDMYIRSPGMDATESFDLTGTVASTTAITSIDADGFTVNSALNASSTTYYYIAFKAAPNLHVGTYVGNGVDGRDLPATPMVFDPQMVYVRKDNPSVTNAYRWKVLALTGDATFGHGNGASLTNYIQSLNATTGQFDAGTNEDVNGALAGTYYFFAFTEASGAGDFVTGALGNQLGLPAAGGVYVFGGTGAGSPLIAYDPVVGSHGWVQQTFTSDLYTDTVATPGDATLRIVQAEVGFDRACIILSWASGGGASITAVYMTTSAPGTSAAYTRASTTFGGLKTGRYLVSDNVLIKSNYFLAAFANRSVWYSTDGTAWTEVTNVMPVGVTPNHAIGMTGSTEITGIVGMFGVFMIAASDGIYKYTPRIDATASYVRGGTGAGTAWPASAVGKKLSVGAPGASSAQNGRLARLGDGGILQTFDGSSTWSTLDTTGQEGTSLKQLPNGEWLFMTGNTDNTGDLYHSPDGATWNVVLAHDVGNDFGVHGFDVAPDGRGFAVTGSTAAANGAQATKPVKIYRSPALDYTTWDLVYTDPGYGATRNSIVLNMVNALTCDKWNANRIWVAAKETGTQVANYWYSSDGGDNWTVGTIPVPEGTTSDSMEFVYNGRILFFGTSADLWYSDDFGATWTAVAQFVGSVSNTTATFLAPYRQSWNTRCVIVITRVGTGNMEVWTSQDNGTAWAIIDPGVGWTAEAVDYDATTDQIAISADSSGNTGVIDNAFTSPVYRDIKNNVNTGAISSARNFLAYPR